MTAYVSNLGELAALKYLVGETAATERLIIRLFKNNFTPSESSITGDFTEASFLGYLEKTLNSIGGWTFTPGDTPLAEYTPIAFVASADQTAELIYGWYAVRASTLDLVAYERFEGAPYSMQLAGDSIAITVKIRARGD